MLSICIPVYNFDIRKLVADLHAQCECEEIEFEILCFDDGSTQSFKHINQSVSQYKELIYKELPQNLGRSKIRNELGKAARFPYLIFMDCDSKVVTENYIKGYIEQILPNQLLYGGRVYQTNLPAETSFHFHWHYGKNREEMPTQIRNQKPYHGFMTNNFLIPRKLFLDIQFDETLTQYGHEDTIFGLELRRREIPIIHIENPLEHIGLEETIVFLEKTKKGIQNLWKLAEKNPLMETKLLIVFRKCQKWKLTYFLRLFYRTFKKGMIWNLKSGNPNLWVFDLFKLGYLTEISKGR